MPVLTFVTSATQVSGVFFLVGLVFSFHDLSLSSIRLYDESEHFALHRLYHSLVLFGGCPCSRGVVHRRGYHSVEKPKSMSEHVVFRCQLLPVLDSISDFGRLLLLEIPHLAQVFCTFSSC